VSRPTPGPRDEDGQVPGRSDRFCIEASRAGCRNEARDAACIAPRNETGARGIVTVRDEHERGARDVIGHAVPSEQIERLRVKDNRYFNGAPALTGREPRH